MRTINNFILAVQHPERHFLSGRRLFRSLLFALITVLLAAYSGVLAQEEDTIIVQLPELTEVKVGDTVQIPGQITCPAQDCAAFAVNLSYDPTLVEVTAAVPGSFMGSSFTAPPGQNGIVPDENLISVGARFTDLTNAPPTEPQGELFLITLTAHAPGEMTLAFAVDSSAVISRSDAETVFFDGVVRIIGEPGPPPPVTVSVVRNSVARGGPASNFEEVGEIAANQKYTVLGLSDDLAWLWIEIAPEQTGWIANTQFVQLDGDISQLPTVNETPTPTPTATYTPSLTFTPSLTYTPTPTVTPSRTPTATPTVPTATPTNTLAATATFTLTPTPDAVLIARVLSNDIRIRSSPNALGTGNVLGQADTGDEFNVFGTAQDSSSVTWYQILFEGQTAYVRGDVVRVFVRTGSGREITLTPSITPTGFVGSVRCSSNWAVNTRLAVIYPSGATRVDLRRDPRGTSPSVGYLENGSRVVVTGAPRSDGRQCWYPVRIDGTGTNGWIEEGSIR